MQQQKYGSIHSVFLPEGEKQARAKAKKLLAQMVPYDEWIRDADPAMVGYYEQVKGGLETIAYGTHIEVLIQDSKVRIKDEKSI